MPVTSLADVFFAQPPEPSSQTFTSKNQNLYRVHFQTVCVQPNNLFELCQLYCGQCKQTSSFRTLNQTADAETQGVCQLCKTTQWEPVFMLQLLVTDSSLQLDNRQDDTPEFARVLLYSNNSLCNQFFNGISPTNLYREGTTRIMLERYIRQICRFNVLVDAVVEKLEVPAVKGRTLSASNNQEMQTVLRLVSSRLKPL